MSEFKREERYIVIKLSKLPLHEANEVKGRVLELGRSSALTECVVVESDWPNYEDTWKAIEQVAKGEYTSQKDKLMSAFGDGWYDGFLAAQKLAQEGEDLSDACEYSEDRVRSMSEDAEAESQIAKNN